MMSFHFNFPILTMKPMLCVSAVNPFLYSRVPILAHVRDMRRKLSKMFNCVHCPSRSSFQQMVGSRRHLFEDNDFFALHDLEDLSKGAFSVLPGLLDMISNKLLLHISKKCSVCQEVAEPCAGGLFCAYPSSMLFPFEEQKIHRCTTCHSPFHEDCFKKCGSCRVCNLDQLSSVTVEDCPGYNAKSKASSSSQRDDDDSQSSCGMESDDKISVQEDDRPKPSKYLARLFGSRESQRERQKQRRTAKILNMTAILGPLEL
ncbi:hypothetical protein O6H91_23G028700 [Diphasiastrum complanatum]|uniref:Uncharacterized protein n=1 Tax=Diphasiastrum complanatum TaxID=34168 RepID=A0ACC2A984_DIPCM|nr:hypothetical protein O6H91_23G028700 [Diphasiastrum complanatum]